MIVLFLVESFSIRCFLAAFFVADPRTHIPIPLLRFLTFTPYPTYPTHQYATNTIYPTH